MASAGRLKTTRRQWQVTPAMAAGVTTRLWDVADLVGLLESAEGKKVA